MESMEETIRRNFIDQIKKLVENRSRNSNCSDWWVEGNFWRGRTGKKWKELHQIIWECLQLSHANGF